jgi:hypothetical protein
VRPPFVSPLSNPPSISVPSRSDFWESSDTSPEATAEQPASFPAQLLTRYRPPAPLPRRGPSSPSVRGLGIRASRRRRPWRLPRRRRPGSRRPEVDPAACGGRILQLGHGVLAGQVILGVPSRLRRRMGRLHVSPLCLELPARALGCSMIDMISR